MIEIKEFSKIYNNEKKAVDNISLKVNGGWCISILIFLLVSLVILGINAHEFIFIYSLK